MLLGYVQEMKIFNRDIVSRAIAEIEDLVPR
jgi:hypothetical protein